MAVIALSPTERRSAQHNAHLTRRRILIGRAAAAKTAPSDWLSRCLGDGGWRLATGAMSARTLPLLFLNLGGEMLYILDQRLRAQSIPGEKARKVMNDIITTMFNKKFMEELFKPQELYSKKALRTVYDRLAHASIMRLNQASMDKLYDLMTMAFKYQVLLCPRPKDILLVTFNHLDAIKDFICDAPGILNQVDETFRQLIEMYGCLSAGEFQLIRQTLLIFFQDMHIRVSIFLKDKVQNSNGRFVLPISGPVPWGTEVPGVIRMFNCNGDEVKRTEFTTGGNYVTPQREGSFELYGDRVLKLGTNMYSVSRPAETHTSGSSKTLASSAKVNAFLILSLVKLMTLAARCVSKVCRWSHMAEGFPLGSFTTPIRLYTLFPPSLNSWVTGSSIH
ncbi:protein OSCP1 isoform X2 [Meleagris gallopavo]|uniref:Organic solute carrier partner 1 n=1 Tax=Meleagris gallopavo TaxID=9103 RepID=G1MWZ4_MELGA|nr:protein OSCP1 isoform X2 [Meleagris gallopavo]